MFYKAKKRKSIECPMDDPQLSPKNWTLGCPLDVYYTSTRNCKWHIGCGLDGGGVWSLGHVGVSLVYTLRTLNVRADLPSSVKQRNI
ncbi:hypothetical protein OUZ56_026354 [Daphnia magna]|uniref:Uncharacterized protein n=1 Tax=Daphnia magna TaxID=35525 RepID=A0ABQ9ZLH9_9CRUS|nr:hypothetical protein OUZ56_026354 [Daphnia magna]